MHRKHARGIHEASEKICGRTLNPATSRLVHKQTEKFQVIRRGRSEEYVRERERQQAHCICRTLVRSLQRGIHCNSQVMHEKYVSGSMHDAQKYLFEIRAPSLFRCSRNPSGFRETAKQMKQRSIAEEVDVQS
jgi:hypothetical protein